MNTKPGLKRTRKILLAEDDPSIQAIAEMALSKVGGNTVQTASNGLEVFKLLETFTPELILLDVMMPEMNGFEVCEKLKSNPKTSSIPIIFLTAKAQTNEIHHGMKLGAVGYILKPFDPMKLSDEINKLV